METQSHTTKYRVWHIPQIPGKAFETDTDNFDVAVAIFDALGRYDLFQFDNRIKPDYANAGGIVVWDENEGEYIDVDEDELDLALYDGPRA